MANAFSKGDVVILKSGGPPMTIHMLPGEEQFGQIRKDYLCLWFRGASAEQGSYAEHVLEKYVAPVKK